MSSKANYTAEEWELLSSAPFVVGASLIVVEPSGLWGILKEIFSAFMATGTGKVQFHDNELIQAIFADTHQRQAPESVSSYAKLSQEVRRQQMQTDALAHCRKVNHVLAQKALPQETLEYKAWLLAVAKHVAGADKEDGFLGLTGRRISEAELEYLHTIAEALGIAVEPNETPLEQSATP
jgi:hypothetical protein